MTARRGQRGFVLVIVLWILAILTVISIGFARRAVMDARAASFTLDQTKAMNMARGAAERGITELRNKLAFDVAYKQIGRTSCAQHWARPGDLAAEEAFTSTQGPDVDQEICRYEIQDEDRRISINFASDDVLRGIKQLSVEARRAISARRTTNRVGEERAFQTIEELRSIEGIGDKEWFGEKGEPGLRDLLTTWGDGRINLNTAPAEVIRCIPGFDEASAEAIIAYRKGPDGVLYTSDDGEFVTIDEVPKKAGVNNAPAALAQYCKVDSQSFTIRGIATRRQGKVRAVCAATIQLSAPDVLTRAWREESL